MKRFILGCMVLGLVACEVEEEVAPEVSTQAQEVVAFDWCAFLGWYGDGQCHWYCPQVNPDCVPDDTCGGFGGAACDADEYCDFPAGVCGYADETGTCKPRPQFCTAQYDPVCACDGNTYGNACEARRHGLDVYAQGECPPPPDDFCGGFGGVQCDADEFCDFPPDAICGLTDQGGICKPRPGICTTQYDPVCGCNGSTYSNACQANAAGTDVNLDDACPPAGPSCAGHCGGQSDGCWCDQYCSYYGDCCPDVQQVCGLP